MITFKDLCEFLTNNQHYSWFYFSNSLLSKVLPEEKSEICVEELNDDKDTIRIWYPKSKFSGSKASAVMSKDMFRKMVAEAIENNDWKLVKELQERMKV